MSETESELNGRLDVLRKDLARNARPWYGTDIGFLLSVVDQLRTERDEWEEVANRHCADSVSLARDVEVDVRGLAQELYALLRVDGPTEQAEAIIQRHFGSAEKPACGCVEQIKQMASDWRWVSESDDDAFGIKIRLLAKADAASEIIAALESLKGKQNAE